MGFEIPTGASVKGLVLAAVPELVDPNFCQTIVYIAEHTSDGALGFVMNRPLGRKLAEVTAVANLPAALRNAPVFEGGPVKTTGLIFARFERGANDEELRCEIVADPAELLATRKRSARIRVFAGHAGWGEGQLDRELREHSWKVCRPHVALLDEPVPPALWPAFVNDDQRWRTLQALLPKNPGEN